jgi:trimeric autotransporter adhesin
MKLRTQLIGTFIGRPRKRLGSTLIPTAIVLICFALLPTKAGAVSPAPDGWYPGYNTAEGESALFSRTTGAYNTALGGFSLYSDTTGRANTAVGLSALRHNVTGEFNTAVGVNALYTNNGDPSNHRASDNCAFGAYALFANTTGYHDCALGFEALALNSTGTDDTANGAFALFSNTSGASNTAVGELALNHNMTGSYNTAIGLGALVYAGGNRNTAVGSGAADNVMTANNVICIGQGVVGADVSDSCYIGNIWNQPGGSQAVYVNSDGKLGFATSSRRFKDDIKPMAQTSEVIYALKPVCFRYKPEIEPTRPRGFGLIAEEVEKLSPDLVTRGADGKVNSVRYDQVNAMLLNEFLKEHKTVQEQRARIAELKRAVAKQEKGIEALAAYVREQDSRIQRVSAQIELGKSAPRLVASSEP